MQPKNAFFALCLKLGFHLGRKVSDERVRALLKRLHPIETRFPLIRIGSDGDGGYLVPDDLDGIVACFSPGVDVTASFESDLVARGIPCFLADGSVDGPPIDHALIDFEKRFLGVCDDEATTTLDGWIKRKDIAGQGDLLLQMDIEGHEWEVLLNASEETLRSFRIIVLELHGLPHCFDQVAFRQFEACLDRLGRFFHVVHSHPNNIWPTFRYREFEIPHFLEITLLRRDRADAIGKANRFPHPLDHACVPGRKDQILPPILGGPG